MMPLKHKLRKCTVGYTLSKSQEKFVEDIKLLPKTKNTNRENIQLSNRNGIWHRKCTMLVMKMANDT